MALFGLFGGSKVDRLVKKLTNAWVQTQERQRIMHVLADMGTDEALFGLLKRFSYRTEQSIVDEDEKQMALRLVVAAGNDVIPAIERYVEQYDRVYYPLKALKEIAGIDVAVELILRVLDKAEDYDGRINEQKNQLVSNLRDFQHPLIQERLIKLCNDENDEVRLKAIDALSTYGEEVALTAIAERLLDENESPSVKAVLFEQLLEDGWSLSRWRDALLEADVLPSYYRMNKRGTLERA